MRWLVLLHKADLDLDSITWILYYLVVVYKGTYLPIY